MRAIGELQDAGVEPDIWKVEGLDTTADFRLVADAARAGGRDEVGCVVLGAGADEATVAHWLRQAATVDGFIGFAIGRTIFWEALKRLARGRPRSRRRGREDRRELPPHDRALRERRGNRRERARTRGLRGAHRRRRRLRPPPAPGPGRRTCRGPRRRPRGAPRRGPSPPAQATTRSGRGAPPSPCVPPRRARRRRSPTIRRRGPLTASLRASVARLSSAPASSAARQTCAGVIPG